MSVQIARSDETPSTSDERYFGYFGRYTVDESTATVTHHVQAGSTPGFDGTDQRRSFRLQGDQLVLATLPEQNDGSDVTYVATWARLQRDRDA